MPAIPPLAKAAATALAKITATLPERVQRQAIHAVQQTYRFEKRPPAPAHLALIRQACWDERALDLTYTDANARQTRRRIWPLSVVFLDRTLMLLAFCTLRQDFRRFRLDLMSDVTQTTDSFRPRRVAALARLSQAVARRSLTRCHITIARFLKSCQTYDIDPRLAKQPGAMRHGAFLRVRGPANDRNQLGGTYETTVEIRGRHGRSGNAVVRTRGGRGHDLFRR